MAQGEFATSTCLSRNTISAIENGKSFSSEALFAVGATEIPSGPGLRLAQHICRYRAGDAG